MSRLPKILQSFNLSSIEELTIVPSQNNRDFIENIFKSSARNLKCLIIINKDGELLEIPYDSLKGVELKKLEFLKLSKISNIEDCLHLKI